MRILKNTIFGIICFLAQFSLPLYAADHLNLEEGLPVELEDPYAIEYRNLEYQQQARFDLTDDDKSAFRLDQRLEYGFLKNWQARVSLPVDLGSQFPEQGLGDVSTEIMYNFVEETVFVPGMALSGRAIYPTSKESSGVDMAWKFLAIKKVGRSALYQRVAVNGEWGHNFDRKSDERPDIYKIVAGYYRALGPTTIGIIDYVRELNLEKDKNSSNIIEIGFRTQFTPLTVAGIGFGVHVDDNSPRFRVTLAFQHSLTKPFYPYRGPDAYKYPKLVGE